MFYQRGMGCKAKIDERFLLIELHVQTPLLGLAPFSASLKGRQEHVLLPLSEQCSHFNFAGVSQFSLHCASSSRP